MTTISTTRPVRSDVIERTTPAPTRHGRLWALGGVGAGLAGIGTVITSSRIDAAYDPALAGDSQAIAAELGTLTTTMMVFHTVTVLSALLGVVFAAGLHRRLAARLPAPSMLPLLAFAGLVGTAVVSVLGSGLDTEFAFGLAAGGGVIPADNAVLYNHWVGTIPWVWVLTGLSGVAVFGAGRQGAVPRWLGLVGLVLGVLTLLVGLSPLQYLAAAPGALWLLVTATGFLVGDKAYREDARS